MSPSAPGDGVKTRSAAAPPPVFIDFEGIDGSGKTTLSNRLARYLQEHGIPVHHARDQGVFRSEISKAIRTLTRDPRFLRMSDVTEFLLYTARDTQMIDEYIRPKLEPGNLVFCDRYLYSAVTHSHHARGLDRAQVDAVLQIAARGLWPDLVVYCDVDPLTSRVRKKIQKVRDHRKSGDFGRKGLMGIGFREEMRNGFLALADEDPDRWLVIDNARATIEESLQRIFDRVAKVLAAKGYAELPNPRWADVSHKKTVAVGAPGQPLSAFGEKNREICRLETTQEKRLTEATKHFYEEMERMAVDRPAFTALYVSGLDTPEAHALREKIVDREPAMVANGLGGLRSPEAMQLRERLADVEPLYIAKSLSGMSLNPEAIALRNRLSEVVPGQIALAIKGNDTEPAWELREKIGKEAAIEVLQSLRGIDTERAWELREKRSKERYWPALLQSLAGIDTERAWDLREKLSGEYLPWVLMSLSGLDSEAAWSLRQEHVSRAPKIIIKTIGRSSDPRAWELRDAAKKYAKEVLDSLSGLDNGPAWQLRFELKEKWPNTAVSSLGAGAQSERAWKFRWEMLDANLENCLLLKHIVKAGLRALEDDVDVEDEDDFT